MISQATLQTLRRTRRTIARLKQQEAAIAQEIVEALSKHESVDEGRYDVDFTSRWDGATHLYTLRVIPRRRLTP